MLLGEGVDFRDGIEVRAEEVSEDERKSEELARRKAKPGT